MATDTMVITSMLPSLNSTSMSVHEFNDNTEKVVKTICRAFFITLLGKANLKH